MARVIESGQYILGNELLEFEQELAKAVGMRAAVGVGSGTDALTIALRAHEVRGEVIVPALTFAGTAEAVIQAGCVPVFADVDHTYTLTQDSIEAVMSRRTAAVIAVHLFGNVAPTLDHPLVIEDGAQAYGSAGIGNNTLALSFYPSKNLAGIGDGGAILTNDFEVEHAARSLRSHGKLGKLHTESGYTSRLDEIQAAALLEILENFAATAQRRRDIAKAYDQALGDLAMQRTPGACPHLYVIEVPNRTEMQRHLREAGIESGVYYAPPLHLQPAFSEFWQSPLPVAEQISSKLLAIPFGPALEDEQVQYVAEQIQEAV